MKAPAGPLFIDADGGLGASPAKEGLLPIGWGMGQWLEGVQAPVWRSVPAEAAYVVEAAVARLTVEALAPVVTQGSRPELTVWWGVEDSVVEHGFAKGPPALRAGERASATFDLALPLGGLVVLPGERLSLRVGTYYADDKGRSAIAVVAGGEQATRVDVTARPVDLTRDLSWESVLEIRTTLRGGRCVGLDPATEEDLAWFPLDVDAEVRGIEIFATRAQGTGPPDIDFVVRDAEGETVAHALGSAGEERILLLGPNLAAATPGEWRLGVYVCTPQTSLVDVQVLVGR